MADRQQTQTTCPYCGVGCGLMVTSSDGEYRIEGDVSHPANRGRLCSKGSMLADTLDLDGRLLEPVVDGEITSWNRALDRVAGGFLEVVDKHGPDAVAFYVSGQLMTEDYYVANKLMKGFIGGANIDTNSRLCMASAVAGHKRAFGKDTVPGCYEDLELADLVVLVGSNLAWCHPVLYQRLSASRHNNPDKKIVLIDPRRTQSAAIADLHLAVKPGTDALLFNGLLAFLQQHDAIATEFTGAHTEGLDAALETANANAGDIDTVAGLCGLEPGMLLEFYTLFVKTARTVTAFSQGVNQSVSGTDKVNSIINAHLATGRIGKRGACPFSVTGQPNAMGGREVGGLANQLAAHMDFELDDIDRVQRFWGSPVIASEPGLTAVDLFEQLHAGKIKAIWIMATNPAVSMPDASRVREALERCELVVVSECVEQTDTTQYADVLLPSLTWGEKDGTVTNSERCISRQRAFLASPGNAKADWWIIAEVAKRLGYKEHFGYTSSADIFDEHARLSAFENDGSRDFNIGGLAGLTANEYARLAPTYWPCTDASSRPSRRMFEDRQFFTPSAKALFVAVDTPAVSEALSEEYPFILNTGRVRDQWHTMTRTGKSARLATHHSEPILSMHPVDVADSKLCDGELARIGNDRGHVLARVQSSDTIRRGEVFLPMHWNEQFASNSAVGKLVNPSTDPCSHQPDMKYTPVSISPVENDWYGFMLIRTRAPKVAADYWTRSAGDGYWQYELAGKHQPAAWRDWLRDLVGNAGSCVEFRDDARGLYRCAVLVDDRLQVCLFVAATPDLPSRSWISRLFNDETVSDATRLNLLSGVPGPDEVDAGAMICACFSVGRNVLLEAIRTQSLVSTTDIGNALQAGTNCGSCLPELGQLLQEARAQPQLMDSV